MGAACGAPARATPHPRSASASSATVQPPRSTPFWPACGYAPSTSVNDAAACAAFSPTGNFHLASWFLSVLAAEKQLLAPFGQGLRPAADAAVVWL